MFCTAQDDTVLMFPTFLQIILDLSRILYICVRGLRLLKFRCMKLICCLSAFIRDGQAALPCWLGQLYKRLWTNICIVWGVFCGFVFSLFFSCFFHYFSWTWYDLRVAISAILWPGCPSAYCLLSLCCFWFDFIAVNCMNMNMNEYIYIINK